MLGRGVIGRAYHGSSRARITRIPPTPTPQRPTLLQNNEITDKGAHKLIDGIKAHHVTCVRVHGRERGPEAWLQHIYFSKNPMTDEAREAIMAAMLWMPPPPKPEMLDEEVMSSIKSSAGEPEDKNEMCCCGYLPPICGFSCCCPPEEEHKNET